MEPIKNRYDFVFLFDVKDGNPNGDPDFDNMPRTDDETGQGLVSDVCIKRKVRNYVALKEQFKDGFDIFIRDGNVLNPLIDQVKSSVEKDEKDVKKVQCKGRQEMCRKYFDVRTFGAVMSTGESKKEEKKIKGLGIVRGPVQLVFGRSIDSINVKTHSLTRCCITKESDADKESTFGNKNNVSYGLYRMHGFISASDAQKTGFSEDDKNLLFEALVNAFEHDRAAARGEMNPRGLFVFKHDSHLGNARSGQLFDLVKVAKKKDVEYPRSFEDYEILFDKEKLPNGVTLDEVSNNLL